MGNRTTQLSLSLSLFYRCVCMFATSSQSRCCVGSSHRAALVVVRLGPLSNQTINDPKRCRLFWCLSILLCLFSSLRCHLPRTLGEMVKLATHFPPSPVLILTEEAATTNSLADAMCDKTLFMRDSRKCFHFSNPAQYSSSALMASSTTSSSSSCLI